MKLNYNALLFIFIALYACNGDREISQIKQGDYIMKGTIKLVNGDTILDGTIKYFDLTGKLSSIINYNNNERDGAFIDYYGNGKISQRATYSRGKLNGVTQFFDSTGKIIYEVNCFYGIEVGAKKTFFNDTFKVYRFTNFEGLDLYRCRWDSVHKIVERGNLLNYVTNYYLDRDEEKLKLSLLIYLINPPHKRITYKLYDKNSSSGDSTLIYEGSSKDGFFQKVYFDPPKEMHKYLWNVEAYYPTENILIQNVLSEDERLLKLPSARE